MVNQIYAPELQLNKYHNSSDTEAPFWDLHLSISNGLVSFKIYDKRENFDFDIVNVQCFFFLFGWRCSRCTSNRVYISELIKLQKKLHMY